MGNSGDSSDIQSKARASAPIAARTAEESRPRPYRWGYFQGAVLIPWSLLLIVGTILEFLKPRLEPWYLTTIALLMGILALPLAFGLLRKKAFALFLVYATFGLSLLLMAIKLPMAIRHHTDPGDSGSAFFESELLLVWLFSLVCYRRRKEQFRWGISHRWIGRSELLPVATGNQKCRTHRRVFADTSRTGSRCGRNSRE
jgi:hypothetical protein